MLVPFGHSVDVLAAHWWAVAVRGLVGILVGVVAFFLPIPTLIALVYLFGAYALLDGLFNLVAAWRRTGSRRPWWALVLSGVAGIAAAAVSFVWPGITALALVYVIAAWALITGGLQIAAAIKLRKEMEGEWLLALTGLVSILLGGLLAVFPEAGAIGLVWYIGAFAFLSGVLMVALSMRLRARHEHTRSASTPMAA
ncbi:conserved membrane protein of unknown function [Nitrospira moscoviensis]|uniref:HdeD family acid-resistance protein n=2 Tax=Nitrospira moscoviensis TaxID=42253 RepID=A0A0K2GCW9_NITMO|nr:conserved membrane protein of unknown function [Nitrospira moscoviensis]